MAQNVKSLSKFPIFSQLRRSISSTVHKCKDKVVCEAPVAAQTVNGQVNIGTHGVAVNAFQKRILVWMHKYPSVADVPDKVPVDKIHKAQDMFRVRVSTYSVGLIAVGALIMVLIGKNAAARGESVEKHNIDWHKDWEKKKAEEAAQKNVH